MDKMLNERIREHAVNILSISGGKDSTCMYLVALEQGVEFRAVFADVGNEHDWTLEYVRNLHKETGGPEVEIVRADYAGKFPARRKAIAEKWPGMGISDETIRRVLDVMHPTGNVFLDACLIQGIFPSGKTKWCTRELKIRPITEQIYEPIWRADPKAWVVNWQGIRAEESPDRAKMPMWTMPIAIEGATPERLVAYRPIIDYTISRVWAKHKEHGIRQNPLYLHGMDRVGCMPCVMSNKGELRAMAEHFPEHVDKIREWEHLVNQVRKEQNSTFLPAKNILGRKGAKETEIDYRVHGIDGAIEWANAARGRRNQPLLFEASEISPDIKDDINDLDEDQACLQHGLCER